MPAEQLSRDNIVEKFSQHNVDEDTINKFISALDECEYERYAPGDAKGNMNKTFESAMTAIMNIEDAMKKKHGRGQKAALSIALMLLLAVPAGAVTKANADAEYAKGNYHQAIADYKELLKRGVSADIYYNLGNAYYRTDDLPHAVLSYERALKLSPGDADIRFNLQFVEARTIDKITPESEMFFVTWFNALVNFTSVDRWATLGIVSIIAGLVLLLLYLFGPNMLVRKIGFFGSAALIVLFLLCNFFAYKQEQQFKNSQGAVVMSPSVSVKKSPAKGSEEAFVIHEGTRVNITDKTMQGWYGIRLADGREGWMQRAQAEEI